MSIFASGTQVCLYMLHVYIHRGPMHARISYIYYKYL